MCSLTFSMKGFLVGSFGLTWALKNPSKILKLAILNSPLTVSSPIPGLFQKLRFSSYINHQWDTYISLIILLTELAMWISYIWFIVLLLICASLFIMATFTVMKKCRLKLFTANVNRKITMTIYIICSRPFGLINLSLKLWPVEIIAWQLGPCSA